MRVSDSIGNRFNNKREGNVRFTNMRLSFLALGLVVALATTGCVEREVVRTGPPPAAVIVQRPPPAEIVETVSPPPGPREAWVWQRGHWRWDGYDYRWAPGHWVERPAHVTEWVAPHWQQHPNGGWIFIEGTWR